MSLYRPVTDRGLAVAGRVADGALWYLVAATAVYSYAGRYFPSLAYWPTAGVAVVAGFDARLQMLVTVRHLAGSVSVPSDPT